MATATRTVTLNVAFLQEIKEDHQELWCTLRDIHTSLSGGRWLGTSRRGLFESLSRLRDQLAMYFALEEAFGYFDDPVSVAPHLCCRAEELRSQHAQLFLELLDIVEQAAKLHYREVPLAAVRQVAHRYGEFYARLQEHESDENDLIQHAFDDDIGVGD